MRHAAHRDPARFTATKSQFQVLACWITFALAPSWISAHEIPRDPRSTTRVRYLMGTLCEVSVAASKDSAGQISIAFEEISRVERLLSTWQNDTPLSRLNAATPGSSTIVDAELFGILERAARWASRTGSAFNPLVGELIDLWKTRGEGALPDPSRLARATSDASITTVTFDAAGSAITRHSSARFEEGAFGKGYAIDRALAALEAAGASRAEINFGGQIGQAGTNADFGVVVTDPAKRDHPAVSVATSQRSASTSSGSEKSFEIGGRRFSHILDPRSGMALPPRGSVTVFASSGFDADVLSTALYVMGPLEGLPWANVHGIEALFIVPDQRGKHKVIPSASLAARAGAVSILDPHFTLKGSD